MKPSVLIATLSTLSLMACGEPVKLNPPPPPPERMVCDGLPIPEGIKALEAFMAGDGIPAYYKGDVDARDAAIARWILAMRDAHESCSSQLAWVKAYYEAQD